MYSPGNYIKCPIINHNESDFQINDSNSPLLSHPHLLKYYLKEASSFKKWNLLPCSLILSQPRDILGPIFCLGSHSISVPSLGLTRPFTFPLSLLELCHPHENKPQSRLLECEVPLREDLSHSKLSHIRLASPQPAPQLMRCRGN